MIALVVVGLVVVGVGALTVREIAMDGYHRIPTNPDLLPELV